LHEEFAAAGQEQEFDRLKVFLTADGQDLRFAEVARALGKSEGAVRVAAHRLRRRFREVFRELIAHTVSPPDELDEEVRHLFAALSD
jgi:RNA polymerase sigma-70 factor (ECF subfamily)